MTGTRPDLAGDWIKCPGCKRLLYGKRLAQDAYVCRECGHHLRLRPRVRIAATVDLGSFAELHSDLPSSDPLGFIDRRPYIDRLGEAVAQTGETEAVVCGTAHLDGRPLVIAAMDFAFMGGSMGISVGEKVTRAAEVALESRIPLVVFRASGGARMQEGILSLLQMAKTSQAFARLSEARVLTICVLTDPTFGGVSASFAMLGWIVVAEPGALIGFAGQRVIAQTMREELPLGFQSSEFLLQHGLIDCVVPRPELRSLLSRLLALHASVAGRKDVSTPDLRAAADASVGERDSWEVVRLARNIGRPTCLDYLRDAFDDFVELHGDRVYADDPAIVAGVAGIGGRSVVIVGQQKGHDARELMARNFGMPHPEGYRKALRILEYAERFRLPIVTLIDSAGAFPGVQAEKRGQSNAIAQIIMCSSRLRVPVVSVVTGEGGSGGALALATGDRLPMLENSFYSVISPEGCAAILWRTAEAAPAAARALRIRAADLLELGVADSIVPEPAGGAHTDPLAAAANLRRAVLTVLGELADRDPESLLAERYARFRLGPAATGALLGRVASESWTA